MKINIKTVVNNTPQKVYEGFDKSLFLALAPPFPVLELLRFDGCDVNDLVEVRLNFLVFKLQWNAMIIQNEQNNGSFLFVDVGTKLPFFLHKWQHSHYINSVEGGAKSQIIDDIYFTTGLKLTDYLMYPVVYLQFLYRVPIYKKIFNKI